MSKGIRVESLLVKAQKAAAFTKCIIQSEKYKQKDWYKWKTIKKDIYKLYRLISHNDISFTLLKPLEKSID